MFNIIVAGAVILFIIGIVWGAHYATIHFNPFDD